MPDPLTTATGYAAAGGLGGGLGAATMLAFIKPKTAWSGVLQIAMGFTWGTFGGKTLADIFHNNFGGYIDNTSYFHIVWCGVILGCVIYALLGAVARYFIRIERQSTDIAEIAEEVLREIQLHGKGGNSSKKKSEEE